MLTELITVLRTSASKASSLFISRMSATGVYPVKEDLAAYFKHPLMYFTLGEVERANQILSYIASKYLREEGDFFSEEGGPKSENPAYQEFYAYINGWIIIAASKLNREDIIVPGLAYLSALQDLKTGGFYTHNPKLKDGITDVITAAHIGLVHLEAKKIAEAIAAGNYLCETLSIQPKLDSIFYLRRDAAGSCIVEFPKEETSICVINKFEPNQLYFMIAYPISYLVELYKITKDSKYIEAAREYAAFALTCHESVFSSEYSHKLAWALSELYKFFPESTYLEAIKRIIDYFISIQDKDGLWFSDDELKCYDQSAEIICWFTKIRNNLESKKTGC